MLNVVSYIISCIVPINISAHRYVGSNIKFCE